MIGTDAIDAPARELLDLQGGIHGPGDDARSKLGPLCDQLRVQRRALLPQRPCPGVVERLLRRACRDLGQHSARQTRALLGETPDDVKRKAVDGVPSGVRPTVEDRQEAIVPPRIEHFYFHEHLERAEDLDRKSTRLNSSHTVISYAVFCLKKKKTQ